MGYMPTHYRPESGLATATGAFISVVTAIRAIDCTTFLVSVTGGLMVSVVDINAPVQLIAWTVRSAMLAADETFPVVYFHDHRGLRCHRTLGVRRRVFWNGCVLRQRAPNPSPRTGWSRPRSEWMACRLGDLLHGSPSGLLQTYVQRGIGKLRLAAGVGSVCGGDQRFASLATFGTGRKVLRHDRCARQKACASMAAPQTTKSVKATQDAGSRRPYDDAVARRFKLHTRRSCYFVN
jgi:hypothetical protein